MAKNLRWKLLIIVGVVALAIFAFYPPDQKIRLGLDLKGGVHLVLRVQTEDAIRLETETAADRLREQLRTAEIPDATVTIVSPSEFRVENVAADKDPAFRNLVADLEPYYNRTPGAGGYTFTMRPNIEVQLRDESVTQALQTIERRVNELGVAEPIVARHSGADQILVQL